MFIACVCGGEIVAKPFLKHPYIKHPGTILKALLKSADPACAMLMTLSDIRLYRSISFHIGLCHFISYATTLTLFGKNIPYNEAKP